MSRLYAANAVRRVNMFSIAHKNFYLKTCFVFFYLCAKFISVSQPMSSLQTPKSVARVFSSENCKK
jgi:hypothetical protein